MLWIWQHVKRTDDYKIVLNCVIKFMKNKSEKEAGKGPSFKKKHLLPTQILMGDVYRKDISLHCAILLTKHKFH